LVIGADGTLRIHGAVVGKSVDVTSAQGQAQARSLAGSVEWLLLELGEWKMIPIENVIAACSGGPTKIAARIESPEQVLGAAFALQTGVDALLVPSYVLSAALIAKAQRGEVVEEPCAKGVERTAFSLTTFEVVAVEEGGVGDRVCVDLTSLLQEGEGMLVGSSASSMVLVHGETVPSEFVPSRPFRVNAGAVHCYILMADKSTKYLSEIAMGSEVMVVSASTGQQRSAIVGRVKVERRPFRLVRWKDDKGRESGTFVQQAETVRLIRPSALDTDSTSDSGSVLVSVTDILPGVSLLGWHGGGGRHVGVQIQAQVAEK
jgi:3-dehydroquinate synthase class II